MATITADMTATDGEQCVVIRGVDWKGYSAVLRVRGGRSRPRIIYLDGSALLVSPSFPHEGLAWRLGQFVAVVVEELDIPCVPSRQTTFRRRKKRGGVEPDESYYLANAGRVVGKKTINLRVDPPPDLAIEAVHTHGAEAALEVYRRFSVPEVWVCDADALQVLTLQENGRYAEAASSKSFPFLSAVEIRWWIARPQTGFETEWLRELRRWVRETLAPRLGDRGAGP